MIKPCHGKKVRLQDFDEKWADIIYSWYYDPNYRAFFRHFPQFKFEPSFFKFFEKWLFEAGLGLFVITENATDEAIGIMTFEPVKGEKNIYLAGIMLVIEAQKKGLMVESFILMSDYLFTTKGASRINVEYLEEDTNIERLCQKGGWVTREKILKDNVIIDGVPKNEVRSYFMKDKFYERYGDYIKSLD